MTKSTSGFTLVELLIVIVVIGLLAAISMVTYNGIQVRADNTKTTTAATAWYKAFKLYETDHGEMPHTGYDSCLGEDYTWDYEGNSSGLNQCRTSSSRYYVIKSAALNALRPYLGEGPLPTPSMQVIGDSSSWNRGIFYQTPSVGGSFYLNVTLKNIPSTQDCPVLAGQAAYTSAARGRDRSCLYLLGTRLR